MEEGLRGRDDDDDKTDDDNTDDDNTDDDKTDDDNTDEEMEVSDGCSVTDVKFKASVGTIAVLDISTDDLVLAVKELARKTDDWLIGFPSSPDLRRLFLELRMEPERAIIIRRKLSLNVATCQKEHENSTILIPK